MKNILWLVLALAMTACTKPVLKQIDVKEAKTLLGTDVQIVDLRTPGEVAATGALPGAAFIDFSAPAFSEKVKQLDKNRPVLLYCASGGRSAAAAEMLHQQKFLMVYDMTPGMRGWLAAGNQTTH